MVVYVWGFPGGSDGKESACSAGGLGSRPAQHTVYVCPCQLPQFALLSPSLVLDILGQSVAGDYVLQINMR